MKNLSVRGGAPSKPLSWGRWAVLAVGVLCAATLAAASIGCGDDGLPDPWEPMPPTTTVTRGAFNADNKAKIIPGFHKPFVPDAGVGAGPDAQ